MGLGSLVGGGVSGLGLHCFPVAFMERPARLFFVGGFVNMSGLSSLRVMIWRMGGSGACVGSDGDAQCRQEVGVDSNVGSLCSSEAVVNIIDAQRLNGCWGL
ncbi:hypothetical protein PILCRDRAFT_88645 [Piloderma croceum F 1598]|uniref:Uncharacterized protein n=1 Tax=Piloderma croceum (strain F 1598) TaxID=765440 RepID=A0A0C3FC19_PILCF|nr:hypothetical protein PILCRDRAFT_88645 [Piloderma croceum F 1598]